MKLFLKTCSHTDSVQAFANCAFDLFGLTFRHVVKSNNAFKCCSASQHRSIERPGPILRNKKMSAENRLMLPELVYARECELPRLKTSALEAYIENVPRKSPTPCQ